MIRAEAGHQQVCKIFILNEFWFLCIFIET